MLRELSVQNLALIEDARVELEPGFCAWTGETGAGKSLLLTALGLLLGEKASADLVRAGKSEARVAAVFEIMSPVLREDVAEILGGALDGDELVVTRRVQASGRGGAHVNGLPVSVATLGRLGDRLIDLHGQHETRSLLNPAYQRAMLDEFGGLGPVVAAYRQRRDDFEAIRQRRQALIEAAERRERERALLQFERDELAAADPTRGEYDELQKEARRLSSAEALREAATEAFAMLYDDDRSVQAVLARVSRKLEPLGPAVSEFEEAVATLERMAQEVREIAYSLRDLGDGPDADPRRLEAIESRLALYRKLSTRFHCTPDDLASRRSETESRLADLERDEADLQALDAPLREAWQALRESAEALTGARRKTIRAFGRSVQSQLRDLQLSEARLTVELTSEPMNREPPSFSPPEWGVDQMEMVFAANPGEPARPMRRVASGGELSRVMLAVKTVLASVDGTPTLIFDEIDTGVGGRLGAVLGKKLAALARHRQVICVTHLPQLASFAGHQWVIRKETLKGRTRTTISPLRESEQRVDELAAMIRGEAAADGTRQEARAMLAEAHAVG